MEPMEQQTKQTTYDWNCFWNRLEPFGTKFHRFRVVPVRVPRQVLCFIRGSIGSSFSRLPWGTGSVCFRGCEISYFRLQKI
jgi:hypothetical protein